MNVTLSDPRMDHCVHEIQFIDVSMLYLWRLVHIFPP